jgi:hypothetical protein
VREVPYAPNRRAPSCTAPEHGDPAGEDQRGGDRAEAIDSRSAPIQKAAIDALARGERRIVVDFSRHFTERRPPVLLISGCRAVALCPLHQQGVRKVLEVSA